MFDRLPIIALCSALLFGCGQGADTPKTQDTTPAPSSEKTAKTVAISAIVEHPSLDDIRRGVIAGLGDLGYKEGQNLTINFQSAQGNVATAGQIAKQFVADKPDAIVAIFHPHRPKHCRCYPRHTTGLYRRL